MWSTDFVGNTIASGDRLRTQIETSRPFLYLFGGEFDRKKLDEDVEKLTAYYRALGFFRARIGRELKFSDSEQVGIDPIRDRRGTALQGPQRLGHRQQEIHAARSCWPT